MKNAYISYRDTGKQYMYTSKYNIAYSSRMRTSSPFTVTNQSRFVCLMYEYIPYITVLYAVHIDVRMGYEKTLI